MRRFKDLKSVELKQSIRTLSKHRRKPSTAELNDSARAQLFTQFNTLERSGISLLQSLPIISKQAPAYFQEKLQRLFRFVDGLSRANEDSSNNNDNMKGLLQLDKGHLLSHVVIGTARALVSLGDHKSQTYAAEWLEKVAAHVETFETEGMKKVVASLSSAWTRPNNSGAEEPQKKRAKR